MGITINEYIIQRRLTCAAKEILKGQRIIDVALKFGYETHSGFDKAFKNKFGYPPKVLVVLSLSNTLFEMLGDVNMNPNELYENLIKVLNKNDQSYDLNLVEAVYQFASEVHHTQKRYSGEPYMNHVLSVTIILAEMGLPCETVMLGLLHDTLEENDGKYHVDLVNQFGDNLANKVKLITETDFREPPVQVDKDIILVKLADRLHNMQTIEHIDKSRWDEKAKETLAIFSQLAQECGEIELKMELDHLSTKYI